jgi:hypothetical protein
MATVAQHVDREEGKGHSATAGGRFRLVDAVKALSGQP